MVGLTYQPKVSAFGDLGFNISQISPEIQIELHYVICFYTDFTLIHAYQVSPDVIYVSPVPRRGRQSTSVGGLYQFLLETLCGPYETQVLFSVCFHCFLFSKPLGPCVSVCFTSSCLPF